MAALFQEMVLASEWVRCETIDGDEIRLNLALAFMVETRKKGTRIRFGFPERFHVDVKQDFDELQRRLESDRRGSDRGASSGDAPSRDDNDRSLHGSFAAFDPDEH